MKPLQGKVAVVAGATRGAGRGIAVKLGEAGAFVYCTGRSVRGNPSDLERRETIDETAEMVTAAGGTGIPVRVDHTVPAEVKALFERIKQEQNGRLDILVNDIWGGEKLTLWGTPFWEYPLENALSMQQRAVWTHLITSYYAVPLMVARKQGLIVEITDGTDYRFRGDVYYSLAKIAPIHLAEGMAEQLRPHGIAVAAVSPGFLRSEEMLDYFGVTEANWRDAVTNGKFGAEHFGESETPYFVGRGIAALAADPDVMNKSGCSFGSWDLSDAYGGFVDEDGRRPHWGNYAGKLGL
jgi:NAD(P)-dependent dehydrogenase (short-subunit alcohol dehydrogenase family)